MPKIVYESELCHHGIKGQKWGIRRYQNYDGTYTGEGRARLRDQSSSGYHKLTSNRAKEFAKDAALTSINIGLGVLGGLQIHPGTKHGIVITSPLLSAGKNLRTMLAKFEKEDGPEEPLKNYKRIKKESPEESIKVVNPGSANVGSGREVNCVACSIAMDLRRRGYDVISRRANFGVTPNEIGYHYKGAVYNYLSNSKNAKPQDTYDKLYGHISKDNLGNSSGILFMQWRGLGGGGHAIYYNSKDGNVTFYDGQSGKSGSSLDPYFVNARPDSFGYIRTDNCTIDDRISKYVMRNKEDR